MPFRRVRVRLVAGALTGGAPTSSRRHVMDRTTGDGRALLEAAQQIHVERHGAQTFLPGTLLPFLEAAKRAGIRSDRQRYHDAIDDLEYEGAIEWDESARYARGTNTTSSPGVASMTWVVPEREPSKRVSGSCLRVREEGCACRSEIVIEVRSGVPSGLGGGDARVA
jgi:hypothetical protein